MRRITVTFARRRHRRDRQSARRGAVDLGSGRAISAAGQDVPGHL